jgi:hypothetical protein
MLTPASG